MFSERPPQPRDQNVWNVRVVVEFLKSMAPNEALPYKDLTMKLVALMAITNADRASDLQALDRRFLQKIDRRFLQKNPEGMLFTL